MPHCSLAVGSGAAPSSLLRAATGVLAPNVDADFVVLRSSLILPAGAPAVEGTQELVSRIVLRGSRAAVGETWVEGRCVHPR